VLREGGGGMTRAYVPRVNEGGNFCGHDPAAPRLNLEKPASERLPLVLRRLMERMPDFYITPSKIPTLNAANNSARQLRSESRESCLLVLASIVKFTDLASLRVGIPTAEGFAGLTIATLANHAGVGLRRAERAVAKLKAAGLLTVASIAEKQADGSFLGVAAVKAVSKHLFGVFGLLEMLKHERDKASRRVKKQARRLANVATRAGSRAALQLAKIRTFLPTPSRPVDPEHRRRLALREIELRQRHPDWPIADIQRQARQDLA
jgi:hypothetical protein